MWSTATIWWATCQAGTAQRLYKPVKNRYCKWMWKIIIVKNMIKCFGYTSLKREHLFRNKRNCFKKEENKMYLVILNSTSPLDKYIWNSCTVHSGIKFSDCLSAWKYLISKKIPELGEENPLSEFCTRANAQVLADIRSVDPWETSSIAGLQITSQGMEDKRNSKAHFPAMRTEKIVERKPPPTHLGTMDDNRDVNRCS